MIPTQRNRLAQLPVHAAIYALRNMVERCFNKLKNARRFSTHTRNRGQLPRLPPAHLDPTVDGSSCQRILSRV